jgi:hypothetical protein
MRSSISCPVASAVVVTSCMVGCATSQAPVFPQALVGTWTGVQRADRLEFAPGGVVVVEGASTGPRVGRCVVEGQTLTIRYQLGSASCAEEPGTYAFVLDGGSLALTASRDTCADRATVLGQSFLRSGS